MKKKKYKYQIDYLSAVRWLNRDLIMINDDIFRIDPDFEDPFIESCDGNPREIFQRFITNFTEDEIEWMNKYFPEVYFAHSEVLDKYILCVDHWGTSWDYCWTECRLEWLQDANLGWVNDKYNSVQNIEKITKFMRF